MSTPADVLQQVLASHETPQYKKGSGPDALPQGQASQLNQDAQGLPNAAAQAPEPPVWPNPTAQSTGTLPQDVQPEQPMPLPYQPRSEQDDLEFAPGMGQLTPAVSVNLSEYGDWIPAIVRDGLSNPGASETLKAIARNIVSAPVD